MATRLVIRPGVDVDPEAVERLTEQEAAARAAGFSPAPPMYALGTRVLPIGADNFRRSRMEFDSLPRADVALAGLIDRVAREQRGDTIVHIPQLHMRDDGTITRGNGPMTLNDHGWKQLLARTTCSEPGAAATYLAAIPPQRRAAEFNAWVAETPEDRTAVLRHRNSFGADGMASSREVFAAVSERYNRDYDADRLADVYRDLIPGDARAEVVYDGQRLNIRVLWHSNIQPETAAAGEIFKAGAGLQARDDGSGAFHPSADIFRNLCLNLLIIDHARIDMGKRRHTGESNTIGMFLHSAITAAVDKVRWFANAWDSGRSQNLMSESVVRDLPGNPPVSDVVQGVFRGLLKGGGLALPGYRRDAATDLLFKSWQQEPEMTRVGVVNAITRTAHTADLGGPWASEDVQRQGSRLLGSKRPFQYAPAGAAGEDF